MSDKTARKFQRKMVLAIGLLLLLLFAYPTGKSFLDRRSTSQSLKDLGLIGSALIDYRMRHGAYPDSIQTVLPPLQLSPTTLSALREGHIQYLPPDSPSPPGFQALLVYDLPNHQSLLFHCNNSSTLVKDPARSTP